MQSLSTAPARRANLLRLPVIGPFLRWRHARTVLQIPLFVLAVITILHGFVGPRLAPHNLATLLTWVHYRGILVIVLAAAGNLFCMGCPFMLPRNAARRFIKPVFHFPHRFRNKWLSIGLLVAILFAYEVFDLWGSPAWTAWLIIGYFAGALVIDGLFKNASFCKYVCPLGQFNFAASTVSPLEVAVADPQVCLSCTTYDCIKGTRNEENVVIQRGCELALFQPKKVGNLDCTFCLDCVHACPHNNVAISPRLPGSELWAEDRRSGIGRLSRRGDISVLGVVFLFGALLNAFGMVSPIYTVQHWLGGLMGNHSEAATLGALFGIVLILEPVLLLGAAAMATRSLTRTGEPLLGIATRFAYSLIPLGLGVWLSHYAFHLLTGLWTAVPVAQQALLKIGITFFGEPRWSLVGLPDEYVTPIEIGLLTLGFFGSLLAALRIAERDHGSRRPAAPWLILCLLLWGAALWLLTQPMEMRGHMMGM